MRYKAVFSTLFSLFVGTANANWSKINDVDYTWGPFNIYHITLFSETGKYEVGTRPLMLTLQYKKPWAGRDFAVSLARTWKNLGIDLPEDEVDEAINKLRKNFPDIKPEDRLHYIALEDKGYFILNDKVVSETFNKAFNDAIVAIWLDPKMDISRQLLDPSYKPEPKAELKEETKTEPEPATDVKSTTPVENTENKAVEPTAESTTENTAESTAESTVEKQVEHTPTEKEVEKPAEKAQSEEESKEENVPNIENPERFISPIYDDIVMLDKHYV